jgi:L-amino acid N-acyltransferase YncA
MGNPVRLKDGRPVVLREMVASDLEPLHEFFHALPDEDRRYLRYDVTKRDLIARRIDDATAGRVIRIVGEDEGRIVADGALEIRGHGWGDGVGEIRLIVARTHQREGLGMLLARELFFRAAEEKLERVVVRMMRPQKGARSIFRRLGFKEEFFIPEQVRDQHGEWQDLVLMRCNLRDLWAEMEEWTEQFDANLHR